MVTTLEDHGPALSTVQNGVDEFRKSWESFKYEPSCGHRATATVEEHIEHFHNMIIDDNPLTIIQIDNASSISPERVENIQLNEFGMAKVSARRLQRLL